MPWFSPGQSSRFWFWLFSDKPVCPRIRYLLFWSCPLKIQEISDLRTYPLITSSPLIDRSTKVTQTAVDGQVPALLFLKFTGKLLDDPLGQRIGQHQYMVMTFVVITYIAIPILFKSGNHFPCGNRQMFI